MLNAATAREWRLTDVAGFAFTRAQHFDFQEVAFSMSSRWMEFPRRRARVLRFGGAGILVRHAASGRGGAFGLLAQGLIWRLIRHSGLVALAAHRGCTAIIRVGADFAFRDCGKSATRRTREEV